MVTEKYLSDLLSNHCNLWCICYAILVDLHPNYSFKLCCYSGLWAGPLKIHKKTHKQWKEDHIWIICHQFRKKKYCRYYFSSYINSLVKSLIIYVISQFVALFLFPFNQQIYQVKVQELQRQLNHELENHGRTREDLHKCKNDLQNMKQQVREQQQLSVESLYFELLYKW